MHGRKGRSNITLPATSPYSTHLTQPLDKGCFGLLKSARKEICYDFLIKNPGKVVTRYEFSALVGKAWTHSMTMTNVIAGFHTTGIFPFNRNALLPVLGSETPFKFNPKSLCEGTKLKFTPVYSPATPAQSKSMPSSCSLLYDFTEEEVALFTKRYSEGYDLTHDPCYNYWVQLNSDEDAMKDHMFSEPDIIEDSNLPKDTITSKDISKESGVDFTKMDSAREEPVQLKHTTEGFIF